MTIDGQPKTPEEIYLIPSTNAYHSHEWCEYTHDASESVRYVRADVVADLVDAEMAEHDAEILERLASQLEKILEDYNDQPEYQNGLLCAVRWCRQWASEFHQKDREKTND